jgi:hypothetical protein
LEKGRCEKIVLALFNVIPAKAGIQLIQELLDPGFRRGDGVGNSDLLESTTLPVVVEHVGQAP